MKVAIRTDASLVIGTGHVMRCITLANALRKRGAEVHFICREYQGDMTSGLREEGFSVVPLPAYSNEITHSGNEITHSGYEGHKVFAEHDQLIDAKRTSEILQRLRPDWLVVDLYGLDATWERHLRQTIGRILVIDDLANRIHECDLLLDQNDFINKEDRYHQLLPVWCTPKLGSAFFLLRNEFTEAKKARQLNTTSSKSILIFFGGSDLYDATSIAIDAVKKFDPSLYVNVVLGAGNPHLLKVAKRCVELPNAILHHNTKQIGQLMAEAGLALAAGGITTYERLAVGLYAITIATAPNQIEPLKYLARERQITYLGTFAETSIDDWVRALKDWREGKLPSLESKPVGSAMNRLVDLFFTEIRKFGPEHIDSTFDILSNSEIRKAFAMTEAPNIDKHRDYWKGKLANNSEHVFALHCYGQHIGNLGLKPLDPQNSVYEGWIYLDHEYGRGFGEFAFRQLIKYAFCNLKLPRLIVHVLKDNKRAIGLYKKIGFYPALDPIDPDVWGTRTHDILKMELPA